MFQPAPIEITVNNACAWSLMPRRNCKQLVMVYSDEDTGQARVSCFTDSGMQKMSAEEFGFDHSLLTDIDRITDGELISRLKVSPVSRDAEWHAGPWSELAGNEIGIKPKKKKKDSDAYSF